MDSIHCLGTHHHHVPAFTAWVPTTMMYLHSLCSMHGQHFFALRTLSPPPFTAQGLTPGCKDLCLKSFTFTALTESVQFTVWVSTATIYLHSLYLLHEFNSLHGSPPQCTNIQIIHCMCSIHCVGPYHHYVPTFTEFTAWVQFIPWVPTTMMYLHSLCSLQGHNFLRG